MSSQNERNLNFIKRVIIQNLKPKHHQFQTIAVMIFKIHKIL